MRERALLLTAGGLSALAVLLSSCGGEDPIPVPAQDAAPAPQAAVYNPCDGLVPEEISAALGAEVTVDAGPENSPRCALQPTAEGGPVLDANYSIFPGGLDAVFATLTELDAAAVRELEVPGADDARLVIDSDDSQLFLSGFVQNGDLIQTLDLVAPEPYDRRQLTRGVREILGDLSAHALVDPP